MPFFVLRCRQELRVRDDLADLGLLAYVPCERVKVRRGRNKVAVERPVWRGYVFLIADDLWPAALAVEGVHDFIRYELAGERIPLPVPFGLMEPIIAAEWDGALDYATLAAYEPQRGDAVRIRSGKWKGFLGRVVSMAKRRVILDDFRLPDATHGFRVTMDAKHLEAAA